MNKYAITCCSTTDLSKELLKERNINYACCSFECNGKIYKDDFGKSYPIEKFYKDMSNGMQPLTSQANIEDYIELFEPLLKEELDVLHISMSSGISGTVNSAINAAEMLNEKYNNKVYVVDSLCCSSGYGMLVNIAKDNQDNGMSILENLEYIEINRTKIIHWFFSSDLSAYVRGGRLSKVEGFVGTALKICPVMNVTDMGRLEVFEKVRTKKKAIKTIVQNMLDEVGPSYSDRCYISHSSCLQEAEEVKELLLETFTSLKEVLIFDVGCVIGAHTGPGTVAMYYIGKKRK